MAVLKKGILLGIWFVRFYFACKRFILHVSDLILFMIFKVTILRTLISYPVPAVLVTLLLCWYYGRQRLWYDIAWMLQRVSWWFISCNELCPFRCLRLAIQFVHHISANVQTELAIDVCIFNHKLCASQHAHHVMIKQYAPALIEHTRHQAFGSISMLEQQSQKFYGHSEWVSDESSQSRCIIDGRKICFTFYFELWNTWVMSINSKCIKLPWRCASPAMHCTLHAIQFLATMLGSHC